MLLLLACLAGGCFFNVNVDTVDERELGDDAGAQVALAPKHVSCQHRAPRPMPPLPSVTSDASVRPTFDLWRSECEPLGEQISCQWGQSFQCGHCLVEAEGEPPTFGCLVSEPPEDCLPDEVVVTHGDGACHACTTRKQKARACCNAVPGLDCRAWPFDQDPSERGELCARHSDCASGLVCKGGRDGYGVCMCPETNAEAEHDPASCQEAVLEL